MGIKRIADVSLLIILLIYKVKNGCNAYMLMYRLVKDPKEKLNLEIPKHLINILEKEDKLAELEESK